MPNQDPYETEILAAYERGELKSVATAEELERLQAAARTTRIVASMGPPFSPDEPPLDVPPGCP